VSRFATERWKSRAVDNGRVRVKEEVGVAWRVLRLWLVFMRCKSKLHRCDAGNVLRPTDN